MALYHNLVEMLLCYIHSTVLYLLHIFACHDTDGFLLFITLIMQHIYLWTEQQNNGNRTLETKKVIFLHILIIKWWWKQDILFLVPPYIHIYSADVE